MKLKNGFVVRTVAGKRVAVATGELAKQVKGMITLNETADLFFGMLNQGVSGTDEIVKKIISDYDIDIERAKLDTEKFVLRLSEMGLISED